MKNDIQPLIKKMEREFDEGDFARYHPITLTAWEMIKEEIKSFLASSLQEAYRQGLADEGIRCFNHSQEAVKDALKGLRADAEKIMLSDEQIEKEKNGEYYVIGYQAAKNDILRLLEK